MTSLKLPTVAALMALSAGIGGGVVYMRPLHPTQQQPPVAMAPPAPVAPPADVVHAVRTVTWFKEHQNDMRSKAALCDDNPGVGQNDPECQNAQAAMLDVSLDNFIKSK